ncbi:MAG: Appr-1-p processing protein [Planctomycetota bacterium]
MIHEVAGDILHSKAHAIVHGVAPYDDFHSGLALALRERWPALYKDFRHWCRQKSPGCGEAWSWGGPQVRIVSLLTQDPAKVQGQHPGRAQISHVNHALRSLRHLVTTEKLESLALPRLATGVGGLAWEEVKPLIARHLGDLGIPIFLYERYQPGVAALEATGHEEA